MTLRRDMTRNRGIKNVEGMIIVRMTKEEQKNESRAEDEKERKNSPQ